MNPKPTKEQGVVYCSQCGAPNPAGNGVEFCGSCGARLAMGSASGGDSVSRAPQGLEAMSIGDLLGSAVRLYWHHFEPFANIAAVLFIPLTIASFFQSAVSGPMLGLLPDRPGAVQENAGTIVVILGSTFALTAMLFLVSLAVLAALTTQVSECYLGRLASTSGPYRVARKCFWRLLLTSLLVGVILSLLLITVIGIPFAVILGVRWSLLIPAIVLEGKGSRQALKRSSSLVKGRWWRVLAVLLATLVGAYLVYMIPNAVFYYVLRSFDGRIPSGSFAVMGWITNMLGSVFYIIAAPLTTAVITILFHDLRIRKEGHGLGGIAGQEATA